MNAQDAVAVRAVAKERPNIVKAIHLVVSALGRSGRLFYVGAGTSGRLGVLDAMECPPTFSTDRQMVQGIIAGGITATYLRPDEAAEDRQEDGGKAIDERTITANDVVMGIATGGTTPFVHGALHRAGQLGAKTIFFSCVQALENEPKVDVTIRPLVGPEVLTGSTRLKGGTATKITLNTITTIAMVQIGKVYENLMVDLKATNSKLWDRGARIISTLTGLDRRQAMDLLKRAGGKVKVAIVMHKRAVDAGQAVKLLERHNSMLREALEG
jgi:N-acetylmuramic acid 6-phosphate etherase